MVVSGVHKIDFCFVLFWPLEPKQKSENARDNSLQMDIRHWWIDLDWRVELNSTCVDCDDKKTRRGKENDLLYQRTPLRTTLPPRSKSSEDRNEPITAHHCDTKGRPRCLKRKHSNQEKRGDNIVQKTINPLFKCSKFHDFFNPSNLQDLSTVLNVIVNKRVLTGFAAQKISMLLSKHNSVTIAIQLCWAIVVQLFLFFYISLYTELEI